LILVGNCRLTAILSGFLPKRLEYTGQVKLLLQFLTNFGLPPMHCRQYFLINFTEGRPLPNRYRNNRQGPSQSLSPWQFLMVWGLPMQSVQVLWIAREGVWLLAFTNPLFNDCNERHERARLPKLVETKKPKGGFTTKCEGILFERGLHFGNRTGNRLGIEYPKTPWNTVYQSRSKCLREKDGPV